jgi:hypothetical protein
MDSLRVISSGQSVRTPDPALELSLSTASQFGCLGRDRLTQADAIKQLPELPILY